MNGLSLFGNIGIAELGFDGTDIDILLYSELEQERVDLYNIQFPDTEKIQGDIKTNKNRIINRARELDIDFIIATPPCQGSSLAGARQVDDPRNLLIITTIEIIKRVNPKYALIENVSIYYRDEIIYRKNKVTIREFIEKQLGAEFNVEFRTLDASDYGVPQSRKRGFVFISRNDQDVWDIPEKTSNKITVKDAIGSLPSLVPFCHDEPSFTNKKGSRIKHHNPSSHPRRHIEVMQHTPSGKTAFDNDVFFPKRKDGQKVKGYRTTYKRMAWDKPAPTITMGNKSISSQNNVHPGNYKNGIYDNPRALSVLELMLLMTIPSDWRIADEENEDKVRKLIGEGIPPLLIYELVKGIKDE